jgi:hypothetical protein
MEAEGRQREPNLTKAEGGSDSGDSNNTHHPPFLTSPSPTNNIYNQLSFSAVLFDQSPKSVD